MTTPGGMSPADRLRESVRRLHAARTAITEHAQAAADEIARTASLELPVTAPIEKPEAGQ